MNRPLSLFAALLLVFASVYLVGSVTRTISDVQDNKDALIRNSNGKYWEPLGSNIQLAINDLGTGGGTVWLPGSATMDISSSINMSKKVVLDMQGSTIRPTGDFHVIIMKEDAQVRNGVINVASAPFSDDTACIYFDGVYKFGYGRTGVSNMNLISSGHKGTGIYYLSDNNPAPDYIMWTTCDNVVTENFKYGLRLFASGGTDPNHAFINGNTFSNFRQNHDQYFITLQEDNNVYSRINGNMFTNFQIEAYPDDVRALFCDGEYNYFQLFVWDWNNSGMQSYAYVFSNTSERNYLVGDSLKTAGLDEGKYNTFMDYYQATLFISRLNVTNFYLPTTAPTSFNTKAGSTWFDPSTNRLRIYNGTAWVSMPLS